MGQAALRFCCALPLLVSASNEVREPRTCVLVVTSNAEYPSSQFFDDVVGWVASGAPRDATGGGLDILARKVWFATFLDPVELPLECVCDMLGVSFANLVLAGDLVDKKEEPWYPFFGRPWEDIARNTWPIFELAAAWAEQQLPVDPEAGLFWRTCSSEEAVEFWNLYEVAAAGDALRAAGRAKGVIASAMARVAALALLANTDLATLPFRSGLCGCLPWGLIAYALSLGQAQPLVTPGYALRLFQGILQTISVDDDQVRDVAAAPWPVLSLAAQLAAAERARSPNLDSSEAPSKAESAAAAGGQAFQPVDGGLARQLMATLRVVHNFLAALGVEYIAIAGTLLGAVRHMARIPWDDDVDLCVDAVHEPALFGVVIAEEALRLGLGLPHGFSWHARRALQYLQKEEHVVAVEAARSLVFRFTRAEADGSADPSAPFVDLWLCWGLSSGSGDEVTLMSRMFGPKVPKSLVLPRRKLPFGELAIWGPADPFEVTRLYLTHSGFSADFMNTCEGHRVHGRQTGNVAYSDKVACRSLASSGSLFAEPWHAMEPGPETDSVLIALHSVFKERLPGLALPGDLSLLASSPGPDLPLRVRAEGLVRTAEERQLWCEALLWCSEVFEDDLLEPGASEWRGQVVRSLVCGEKGERPAFVWEDKWS